MDAPIDRPLAVFVGAPGGALDRIVADPDVTTFLNDRFLPWFLPPEVAPELPEGALILDEQGCVLAGPLRDLARPGEWIAAANAVLLARAEGRARPWPLRSPPQRFGLSIPADHPLWGRCALSAP